MSPGVGGRSFARILLVNDDPTVADSCARALRLDGYEVWAALSAEDGLRLAQAHAPQAVVVDIRTSLPRALGLARSLRELPRLAGTPIAIVSGDLHPTGRRPRRADSARRPGALQAALARRARGAGAVAGDRRVSGRFLQACRLQPVDATPVWFMRQAGRYMAEYRALRERHSLLEICREPDLATEVTLQPLRRIEVDAAILFSDLLIPLAPLGLPFDFVGGEGPRLERPLSTAADIDALAPLRAARGTGLRVPRPSGRSSRS